MRMATSFSAQIRSTTHSFAMMMAIAYSRCHFTAKHHHKPRFTMLSLSLQVVSDWGKRTSSPSPSRRINRSKKGHGCAAKVRLVRGARSVTVQENSEKRKTSFSSGGHFQVQERKNSTIAPYLVYRPIQWHPRRRSHGTASQLLLQGDAALAWSLMAQSIDT
jgi:hypothetical protein